MMAASSVLVIEEQILAALKEAGGSMSLEHLLLRFDSENRAMAELKAMMLAKAGTLHMERTEAGYTLTLSKRPILQSPSRSVTQATSKQNPQLVLAATIPFSMQRGMNSLGIASTEEVFEDLLRNAKRYVKMSLPFPEEAIIVRFASLIGELARRQVKLQILTREVFSSYSKVDGTNYPALHKSLLRLWDVYRARGNEHLFELRDFHKCIGSRTRSMHYESTHAKIISVDGRECYVGSAEFRINSIYNNFELGFFVSGEPATQVENVYDLVWRHSKPVEYWDLRRGISSGPLKPFKGNVPDSARSLRQEFKEF